MTTPLAALDLGTNSTRFICVEAGERIQPASVLSRGMTVTRLGEGVDGTGEISDDAIGRVLATVRQFDRDVAETGGRWAGAVATSACRRASESSVNKLFEGIQDITGIRPELISGNREAELIYRGIRASLDTLESGQIMDIGGGSTEWITFGDGELESVESLEVGVVTLFERCVEGSACSDSEVECMNDVLEDVLIPRNTSSGPLVCVGGTGTTLSSLRMNLSEYDPVNVHGSRLTLDDIDGLYRNFLGKPFQEIGRDPMVQSGREEVLVPGILILKSGMRKASVREVLVSDMGILAGVISEVMNS